MQKGKAKGMASKIERGHQNSEQKWAYDDPDAPRVKWLKSER